ncbi:MAG: hypothetical protein OXF49_00255 [Candidatus Saccharibacteria bacterium]|nr:hypothetical protein [Candidatus Saccharibacteria bacterium]
MSKIQLKTFKPYQIGSDQPQQTVIFVQGFGVKSDSKGLFTDLADYFHASQITSFIFHLSDYDQFGNSYFLPLNKQQERLINIYNYVLQRFPDQPLTIIGHSLGSGVLSSLMLNVKANKYIILAPTMDSPGPKIKSALIKHRQAQVDGQKISFKRKNGVTSTFSQEYVDQFDIKFSQIYQQVWPKIKDLQIIIPDQDLPRYDENLLNFFQTFQPVIMPDCDHNFSDQNRQKLAATILQFLRANQET